MEHSHDWHSAADCIVRDTETEGYQSSGYEFLSRGSFVLIDAAIFIPGLLFVILGNIIMEGFSMQKEMDEIL